MAARRGQEASGDQGPTDKQMNTAEGIKWSQFSEIVGDRWATELLMKWDVIVVLLVQQHKDKETPWFLRGLVYWSSY